MRVVHICLASFFPDNYSYQENMLPKYHKQLGYDVEVIASLVTFDKDGKYADYSGPMEYTNEYGIPVIRLRYKNPEKAFRKLRRYIGFQNALEKADPGILFIHGCQFLDIDVVVKYLKSHPNVKVFVDNHADFNNSAQNFLSKNILHKVIWKRCAHMIEPYTTKFYGVLPARVDFLKEVYDLPPEKCDLLVMGADDEAVEAALQPEVRINKRAEYGVSDGDFVIVTGGKIDHNKPQVLTLMKAVNELADNHIKLVVFGSVSPELKEEFDNSISETVKYVGWRKSEEIYSDFAAADLVAFPGLHSVLWEQAVGMGKPCVFKRIKGFDHIDLNGNCLFFDKDDAEEYKRVIKEAIQNIDSMKDVAEGIGKEVFSYKAIAKRALEG